ncbi:phosphate/phosphite/phosphonate ABC transporter substrate-binding protein [Yoonia sp. R2331]|uniref:phosphate/phosphite/phosphonate ABC transporter substrate-binding protein n=1 Tax=Yoonia sp. R2331 TaxID=3237238 RepID=UPI0034E50978
MYDRPANAAAHDRLWAAIREGLRDRGIDAPDGLSRDVLYRDSWARDDLVLGQICVLPWKLRFEEQLTLIGASDYGVDTCPPGFFNAVMLARADDPRDTAALFQSRFVANARHSQSGYGAGRNFANRIGLRLPEPEITGAHDVSVQRVADGTADFCFVDAHTFWMQQQDLPAARACRVVHRTRPVPGQSLVTRKGADPAPFLAAIKQAIAALATEDRAVLGLRDVIRLPDAAYDITIAEGVAFPG